MAPWTTGLHCVSMDSRMDGRSKILFRMNCDSGSRLSDVKQEEDPLLLADVKCEQDIKTEINIYAEDHDFQGFKEEIQHREILGTTNLISNNIKTELVDEIETKDNIFPVEIVEMVIKKEGSINEEDHDFQDIEEEIPQSEILAATDFISNVEHSQSLENIIEQSKNNVEEKDKSHICSHGRITFDMDEEESVNEENTCIQGLCGDSEEKTLRCHVKHKTYKCNVCYKSFSQKALFSKHLCSNANNKLFSCDYCRKSFDQKCHLTKHLYTHRGENPSQSQIEPVSNKDHIFEDQNINKNEKIFKCNICWKSYTRRSTLDTHLYIHTGEKPFKCDLCSESFASKYFLSQHSYIHTNNKPFTCDLCLKSFCLKSDLSRHSCVLGKPFNCKICLKSFSYKSALSKHLDTHTEEKQFKCNVCSKSFSKKYSLSVHSISHMGEKPLKCYYCTKKFYQKSFLFEHLRTHTKGKTIQE